MPVVDCTTGQVRDHTSEEQAAIDAARAEMAPSATEQAVASGYVTVTAGSVSSVDGYGFSSAVRFGPGRIRFYFEEQQPDGNYIAIASVRHSADLQWRISSKTPAFVEIRSSVEALEYGVAVSRIMR
jgi:hypothetical protein